MDIIVLKTDATDDEIKHIVKKLESRGLKAHISQGTERIIIGVIGDTSKVTEEEENSIRAASGVENVVRILKPYKLASREFRKENTVISVQGVEIGGKKIPVMAGPCAVENRTVLMSIAEKVKAGGAAFLRGGAYKPRTSPYSFQGLGEEGLKYLAEAREKTGLAIITEIMDPRDLDMIVEYTDILQIGARNMQNFRLLLEVGSAQKPVLLKRGLSSTIKEWLMSAEYIMSRGNHQVMLCERGIRTFETATRNTADLSIIPLVKSISHLPVIFDPSHATGTRALVPSMALASVVAGAHGVMIEVHPDPEHALSDGMQSLNFKEFERLFKNIIALEQFVRTTLQ